MSHFDPHGRQALSSAFKSVVDRSDAECDQLKRDADALAEMNRALGPSPDAQPLSRFLEEAHKKGFVR